MKKTEKESQELQELVLKYFDNPKKIMLISLSKKQVKSMAILKTIMDIERNKFRVKLIEIRLQMDIPRSSMIQQTKKHLTNLIKELQ